jgi:outer membrane protein TolC
MGILAFVLTTAFALPARCQTAPLTWDDCVKIAIAHNPSARAAAFARVSSIAQASKTRPQIHPTVEATASGTLQQPSLYLPGIPDAPVMRDAMGRVGISIEQIIYHAGGSAAQDRYLAQSSVADFDLQRTLSDLALTVRKSYISVLRADAGVTAANDGLKAATRYREVVKRQIDVGRGKPVDMNTADAQVADAQSGVTQATGGAALARLNLNRLLGRPLDTAVDLSSLPENSPIPDSPGPAQAIALAHRPEILLLKESIKAAKAGVVLAKSQSFPTLSFRGELAEETPTVILPQTWAAATIELRWRPSQPGADSDTKQALAEAHRLEAMLEDAELGMRLDVTQAWQRMREARDRIALAQVQLQGADATALAAETAYTVGRGSAIEVEGAQREVRTARDRLLQAQYDLKEAFAEFEHAQGTGTPYALPPTTEAAR